ncbi:MAG: helix-turn-helix transcriptional regulator [Planctomycetota bacterium]
MAMRGMTYEEVVSCTGLDSRTIRGVVRGNQTPQARTLHRLADGFGVPADELFKTPDGLSPEAFDAATNPVVELVKQEHPDLFAGWSGPDFAQLSSRFGVGGALTAQGVVAAAAEINTTRATLRRAQVVLETPQAGLLTELIDLLYERARTRQ